MDRGLDPFVQRAVRRRLLFATAIVVALGAATWVVSSLQLGRVDRNYDRLAGRRLEHVAAETRTRITRIESELSTELTAVASPLTNFKAPPNQAGLFSLLRSHTTDPNRGFRILDAEGHRIAWWGETLPVDRTGRFSFDVTHLYIVVHRQVTAGGQTLRIDHFQILPNEPQGAEQPDPDSWIDSARFHAGVLQTGPESKRFLISRTDRDSLYVDLLPTSKNVILRRIADWRATLVSLLAALYLLALALVLIRRARPTPWNRAGASALLILARTVLLAVQVERDPTTVFGFATYGSRILGPFTRSPFDLLLTSLTLFAVIYLTIRSTAGRWKRLSQAVLVPLGALGFIQFAGNLVDNSRVSALPEHIVPASLVQAVLLTSILLVALALVELSPSLRNTARNSSTPSRHSRDHRRNRRLHLDPVPARRVPRSCAGPGDLGHRPDSRTPADGPADQPHASGGRVDLPPLSVFQEQAARSFVATTYAPLVIGEGGQSEAMIEQTLAHQFQGIDLATILPDHLSETNLTDLAYALWIRSDLPAGRSRPP